MKTIILLLFFIISGAKTFAQSSNAEQEIINLSKMKWQWAIPLLTKENLNRVQQYQEKVLLHSFQPL
jgi:hypothetical protein